MLPGACHLLAERGAGCCDANSPGCCHTPPRCCRHPAGASPCGCPCGLGRSSLPGISREGGPKCRAVLIFLHSVSAAEADTAGSREGRLWRESHLSVSGAGAPFGRQPCTLALPSFWRAGWPALSLPGFQTTRTASKVLYNSDQVRQRA